MNPPDQANLATQLTHYFVATYRVQCGVSRAPGSGVAFQRASAMGPLDSIQNWLTQYLHFDATGEYAPIEE